MVASRGALVKQRSNMNIMKSTSSLGAASCVRSIAPSAFAARLLIILVMLALGGLSAQARRRGPVLPFNATNTVTMAQGSTTNVLFTVEDDAVGWSGIQTTTATFLTNGVFSDSILVVSNLSSLDGPPPSWTNRFSYETNRLTITPGQYQYGTNVMVLISTDIWGDSTTNRLLLRVYHVSQPPSFAFKTNPLVVLEESGAQTNSQFVKAITNGAGNPPGLAWKFTTTFAQTTNGVIFRKPPVITNYNGSIGLTADLVFAPTNNSFGSNLVTVVMTDAGSVINGGRTSFTNSFWLVVAPVVHPPVISWATNRTILENGPPLTNVTIRVTGDSPGSVLGLTVASGNTNVVLASVTATNVTGSVSTSTNYQFNLTFAPVLNGYGTITNKLIASEVVGSNTFYSTNSLVLTVAHVTQPPSLVLATNEVVVAEESGLQSITNFVKNISAGAGNAAGTLAQFKIIVRTVTNTPANARFTGLPAISVTNGILTFTPAAHSFGTNLVTVTLTNLLGSTASGGVTSFTTNFLLEVRNISHTPTIVQVPAQTMLENSAPTNIVVTVWTFDAISNNLALAASSQNANMAVVSVIATNVMSATNTQFTLRVSPVTNAFGTNAILLTASVVSGTTNVRSASFPMTLTHVTQPPSFAFATDSLLVPEQMVPAQVTRANFVTAITNGAGNPPGTNWTFAVTAANKALFATNGQPAVTPNGTLTFTPTKLTNGTTTVTVVMTDKDPGESAANGGVLTCTKTFTLGMSFVSQTPSFSFATNVLVVQEEAGAQTNANFITAINTGLGIASTVTWTFDAVTATNDPINNAQFTAFPEIATNGTLTFSPMDHSFGTNRVTVVMTDSGTNGSCTNSFLLEVVPIAHAPVIEGVTNLTTLENSSGTNLTFNVWDYDVAASNLVLSVVSLDTNIALASVTATNVNVNGLTNTTFTVAFTPVTNMFGLVTNQIIASEIVGTNLLSTTNYLTLTVEQVSQPPSFAFAAPALVVPEHAGLFASNNFVTAIDPGAGNPPGLTWTFTVFCATNDPGNVMFSQFPTVTTNGTLSFTTADYSYGTNTVIVVMTDSGSAVRGGIIAFTNSFTLQVPWINQAPSFDLGTTSTTVNQYNVPVTISNAVINVLAGPSNETNSQTVNFLVSNDNSSLLTSQPAIDASGTLTFTPGSQAGTVTVQIQAHDNGGTANGGVDTSVSKILTIIIPTNTFVNAAGTFQGVFFGTNTVAQAGSGKFNLTLATNGTFDGYLICENDSNSFSGQFSLSNSSVSVTASNYVLNLTVDTSSKTISGSVSNTVAHLNSSLLSFLSGYGNGLDGTYLVAMPGLSNPKVGSLGESVFSMDISSGLASLHGFMADTNTVSQTALLCANGYYPVYIPLYTNANGANGLLIGWLNFNGVTNNSVSAGSTLIWISATNATDLYPKGFTNSAVPSISTYDSSQAQLLPINKGYVQMVGGSLTIPAVEAVTIVNNQIIVDPSVNNGLSLTIDRTTGKVSGSFVDGNGDTNQITSVILQNDSVARGYFQGPGQSGSFILVANAALPHDPPFPAFTGVTPHGAVTASGVTVSGITNVTFAENSATNGLRLSFTLYDPLTNFFNVTCSSSDSSVVSVAVSGNTAQRDLWFAPVTNKYGSNITVIIKADDGTLTNSFTINVTVSYVNHAPTFDLATNAYTVNKYGAAVSVSDAITNIVAGPSSESWQSVSFNVTNNRPDLFSVQPAVDSSGTLSYTPNQVGGGTVTVQIIAQDNGGTDNGGADSSAAQTIAITIPSNPFTSLLSGTNNTGTFIGLFSDTNATSPDMASSGYFNLTLADDGSFTGYLIGAGATNAFAGKFSIAPFNATVTLANDALSLKLDPIAGTIAGTVTSTSPSWTAAVQSYLAAAPSLDGTYLVAMPGVADSSAGPAGDSVFTAVIDTNGVVTLAGHMADDTSVTLASQLSAGGNCPIYTPLYTNGVSGLLIGWLNFTNDAANNAAASSSLTWFDPAGATPALYGNGFTNQAVPLASIHHASPSDELTGISHYAVLTGSFVTLGTNSVTMVNNVITSDPSAPYNLSLTVNPATGEIQGSFVYFGFTNFIESVVLQDANVARGYFVSANGLMCGSIVLYANYTVPAGPYPISFTGITNVTMLENASPVVMPFSIFDPLTTNITSVVCSPASTNVTVTVNSDMNALTITPAANFSGAPINFTLTAVDDNAKSNSVSFSVTVSWVNQVPSFNLAGGVASGITVDKFDAPVTVSNAVINVSPGAGNNALESGQAVDFIVTNDSPSLFASGGEPVIDGSGTLTFTPGKLAGTVVVSVQAHDNGGVANGGVDTSASQTFTIHVPGNEFASVTDPVTGTGTFVGLFYETNGVTPDSSGYFTLTLTNDGTFNVSLVCLGATNSVDGQFSTGLHTNVTVTNYVVDMTLDTAASTVMGSVSNTVAHWNAELQSYRAGGSVVTPGSYNLTTAGFDDVTEGPTGDNIFNVAINSNGVAIVAGYLADDTAVAQVSPLTAAGYCPIYASLYGNGTNGVLWGWLTFTNDASNANVVPNSALTWVNKSGATTNLYPAGFTNAAAVQGASYMTDSVYTNNLLGSSSSSGIGYVLLSGGNLGANPVVTKVGITNNIITVISPQTRLLSLSIVTNTGLIQGQYIDSKNITNNLQGAIFQNDAVATGYFMGVNTNESGLFMLFGN